MMFLSDQIQKAKEPTGDKEEFHDPQLQLDESSLETQTSQSSSINTDENDEQTGKFAQDYEKEVNKTGTGLLAAVGTAVGTLGTKVGYYPTQENTPPDTRTSIDEQSEPVQGESWSQRTIDRARHSLPPITPQNSTVEGLDFNASAPPPQSWISKAVGIFYDQPNKEDTLEEGNNEQEEDTSFHLMSDNKEGEKPTFRDASDAFVQ